MDEYLVGELQCPVCLELLNWPIILPCSHVLCRDPCAERLFVHGFIRCPVSGFLIDLLNCYCSISCFLPVSGYIRLETRCVGRYILMSWKVLDGFASNLRHWCTLEQ